MTTVKPEQVDQHDQDDDTERRHRRIRSSRSGNGDGPRDAAGCRSYAPAATPVADGVP